MARYLAQAADRVASAEPADRRAVDAYRTERHMNEVARRRERREAAYKSFMAVLRELVPGWRPFPGRFDWGEVNGHIVGSVVLEGKLCFTLEHHPQESAGHRVSGIVGPVDGDDEGLYSYGKLKGRDWLEQRIIHWGLA